MDGFYSTNGYEEIAEGVKIKSLCKDDTMLLSEFVIKKGSTLPHHSHPNVQSAYLLKGKIRLFVNGSVRELVPGSSWCIQDNLEHWAEVQEDSVILEVFRTNKSEHSDPVFEVEIYGKRIKF